MVQIGIGILVGALIWAYVIVYELGGGDEVGLLVTTDGPGSIERL
jgi:hypothetical protein